MSLAIDGFAHGHATGTSCSATLTTLLAGTQVIVDVGYNHGGADGTGDITGVSATGLTFAQQSSFNFSGAGYIYRYWAFASAAFSGAITAAFSNGTGVHPGMNGACIVAYGVNSSGAAFTNSSPFDANAASFGHNTGSASPASVSGISSNSANGMVLSAYFTNSNTNTTPAAGSGFTFIDSDYFTGTITTNVGTGSQQKTFTGGALSSATEAWTTTPSGNWFSTVDVIAQPAGGASGGLRFNSNMDGLGAGGAFFRDPLAGKRSLGWRPSLVAARRKLIVPRHAELRLAA